MTVRDLIEQLEEMNPEAEVRFAFQPRYPLEYRIGEEIVQTQDESKVYIADAGQIASQWAMVGSTLITMSGQCRMMSSINTNLKIRRYGLQL